MNVGGPTTTAVYLSPQAISPLSASTQPIELALAARPDFSEPAEATAEKAASKQQQATAATRLPAPDSLAQLNNLASAGAAMRGRVDIYV